MYSKTIVVGRLGRDVELKEYGENKVARFSVATSYYQMSGGDKTEQTEWYNVSVWNKVAENCAKFLSKGSLVLVEGTIQTRTYKNSDGVDSKASELKANTVKFLSTKKESVTDNSESPFVTKEKSKDTPDEVPF